MSTQPSAITQPEPMSMGEVLRIPTMRRLWYAQLVSTFGDFLALFAVIGVLTFNLHATPQQVTGVQIAYLLPIAVLGVLAGVFVDRWPLKPTLVALRLYPLRPVHPASARAHALQLLPGPCRHQRCLQLLSPAQGVTIRSAVPLHGLARRTL